MAGFIKQIKKQVTHIMSYLGGSRIAVYQSPLNGRLEVWMINGRLVLNSKNANQSFDSLHRVFQIIFKQIDLKNTPVKNILLLGTGAGSVVSILRDELKIYCPIDAVEYDSLMIEIARKYFGFDGHKSVQIIIEDAHQFVSTTQKKYDLIIADLFRDDAVPDMFYEEDFNAGLLQVLDKGKIIFNTINRNLSQLSKFEKLKHFYAGKSTLLINSYSPMDDNDVLVIDKK